MSDIKKKFIDILFESDDEDELEDVQPKKQKVQASKKEEIKQEAKNEEIKPILAKDVLYRKSNESVFINLDENSKTNTTNFSVDQDNNEYELSSQISPIFGLINDNKKKPQKANQSVIDTLTNKPSDSHLDIITSPIYGYGTKRDIEDSSYDEQIQDDDYQDYNDEDLNSLFSSNEDNSLDALDNSSIEDITLFKLFGDKQ